MNAPATIETATLTGFAIPEDGWFHIATPGEWPHKPTGLIQVIDDDAMQSIVDAFVEHSKQPNWPGVLIDFDHQSLDEDKPTTAAGWIWELERRSTGIWAKIRWSDLGRTSIEGGRYRFISPVWRSTDCAMLDGDRIRPLKLMNCAVTNDPNIKGLFPLSNAVESKPLRFSPPALPITHLANAAEPPHRMTDEQRKAMFAAMGGVGGGGSRGGGGGGGGGGAGGQSSNLPPRPPPTLAAQRYIRQIDELQQRRRNIEGSRPPRPERHPGYDRINVNDAVREAFRSGKIQASEISNYRRELEQQNRDRRNELSGIKRNIRNQYKTREQQERALQRYLDRQEKEHQRDLTRWERANREIDRAVAVVDRSIHQAEIRVAREEDKLVREEIRSAINRDKQEYREYRDGERQELADTRERRLAEQFGFRQQQHEERQAARTPTAVAEYRAELTRRKTYYEAVQRGDRHYAERLYPGADHDRVIGVLNEVNTAGGGQADQRQRRELLNDIYHRPPPMRPDPNIVEI